jgi:hypothetical protein
MSPELTERERDDGLHRFGGEALVPTVPAKVVAELELALPPTVEKAGADQSVLGKDNAEHVALARV